MKFKPLISNFSSGWTDYFETEDGHTVRQRLWPKSCIPCKKSRLALWAKGIGFTEPCKGHNKRYYYIGSKYKL